MAKEKDEIIFTVVCIAIFVGLLLFSTSVPMPSSIAPEKEMQPEYVDHSIRSDIDWSESASYTPFQMVYHANVMWFALEDSTGREPGAPGHAAWDVFPVSQIIDLMKSMECDWSHFEAWQPAIVVNGQIMPMVCVRLIVHSWNLRESTR